MEVRTVWPSATSPAVRSSGSLRTESCNAGRWRYSGRKNGINVIFTFDTDEEGNLLVIVTLIRED
jgi:hypothetical protein